MNEAETYLDRDKISDSLFGWGSCLPDQKFPDSLKSGQASLRVMLVLNAPRIFMLQNDLS